MARRCNRSGSAPSSLRRGDLANRRALYSATAAVLCQISDDLVHRLEVRGIDERSAFALIGHKAATLQLRQMKRQRGRRQLQALGYASSSKTFRSGLDEQAIDAKPRFLGDRLEGSDHILNFHLSNIIKIRTADCASRFWSLHCSYGRPDLVRSPRRYGNDGFLRRGGPQPAFHSCVCRRLFGCVLVWLSTGRMAVRRRRGRMGIRRGWEMAPQNASSLIGSRITGKTFDDRTAAPFTSCAACADQLVERGLNPA